MALASNAFDLLASSLIVEDPKAKAAFEAAEAKRREEAKEAARKRKDAEKKLKEAERKKKELKEKAERRRKEEEERASMERWEEDRRRWFEIQELKKKHLEQNKRREENRRILEENQRKQKEEDEKLREENPEKWEAEMKRREKEGLKAAVLGLLRHPPRFSSSPSQKRQPGYKQGQVQRGVETTISKSSFTGSVSGYSSRPSTSDQTQGSLKSEAAKNNGLAAKVKDNGTDGEGWQVVRSRRRRNQGTYNAAAATSTPVTAVDPATSFSMATPVTTTVLVPATSVSMATTVLVPATYVSMTTPVTTTVPVVPAKENVVVPATNGEKGHMSSTSASSERSHYTGNGKVASVGGANGSGQKYYANSSSQRYNGNDYGQMYYSNRRYTNGGQKKQAKPKPFIDAQGWQVVQNRRRVCSI